MRDMLFYVKYCHRVAPRWFYNYEESYRRDPFPGTGNKGPRKYKYHRHMKTYQEKRANELDYEYVRASRHPRNLPSVWDDVNRIIMKSWKFQTKNRKQYRIKKGTIIMVGEVKEKKLLKIRMSDILIDTIIEDVFDGMHTGSTPWAWKKNGKTKISVRLGRQVLIIKKNTKPTESFKMEFINEDKFKGFAIIIKPEGEDAPYNDKYRWNEITGLFNDVTSNSYQMYGDWKKFKDSYKTTEKVDDGYRPVEDEEDDTDLDEDLNNMNKE